METALASKPFDFQDVLRLVELIKNSTTFSELRIRSGDLEIEVRRGPPSSAPVQAGPATTASVASPAPVSAAPTARATPPPAAPVPPPAAMPAASTASAPAVPRDLRSSHPDATIVTAPMVGTVYRAPEPGAEPFVEVGQRVEAGDRLCIIEVMKLMNAIRADGAGTVAEILFADAEAVAFGQPLFVIAPH